MLNQTNKLTNEDSFRPVNLRCRARVIILPVKLNQLNVPTILQSGYIE